MYIFNKCNFYRLKAVTFKIPLDEFFENLRARLFILVLLVFLLLFCSCKKIIDIPEPSSTITTAKVFSTETEAKAAMAGVYYYMVNNNSPNLCTGGMTIYAGLSSDELALYDLSNTNALQFYENSILPSNNQLYSFLWAAPYSNLYHANAVIEGLARSLSISDSLKKELIAEAKFVRAFINFNLVNLYGDIPFPNTTNWRENRILRRLPKSEIYQLIISDLSYASTELPEDFRGGHDQRIVPTKWAALALLARVYLYLKDWSTAEIKSTEILNHTALFNIETQLDDVFKPNSSEAIWQLQQDNKGYTLTATTEGAIIIPRYSPVIAFPPFAYINNSLLNAFEPNDQRKTHWLNSKIISGTAYYYPFKYKTGISQAVANGEYSEYYMVLRLAEQYLIRAESRAMQNKLTDALADLNIIRKRAGLPSINQITQEQILEAIDQERRIELFAEWGHRWLDLIRRGKSDTILAQVKGANWNTSDKLYPIPLLELQANPNLFQNQGY